MYGVAWYICFSFLIIPVFSMGIFSVLPNIAIFVKLNRKVINLATKPFVP